MAYDDDQYVDVQAPPPPPPPEREYVAEPPRAQEDQGLLDKLSSFFKGRSANEAAAPPKQDEWAAFRAKPAESAPAGKTDEWAAFRPKPAESEEDKPGPLSTMLRHAAHAVLPTAGAVATAEIGAAGGAAVAGPAGALVGGALGGLLGYAGTSYGQEESLKALGFDDSHAMAAGAKLNPKSALAGDIAGSLPFFGPGAASKGLRAAGAAFGVGAEGVNQYREGEFDPLRLAGAGAAGAVLTKPTRAAEAISTGAAKFLGREAPLIRRPGEPAEPTAEAGPAPPEPPAQGDLGLPEGSSTGQQPDLPLGQRTTTPTERQGSLGLEDTRTTDYHGQYGFHYPEPDHQRPLPLEGGEGARPSRGVGAEPAEPSTAPDPHPELQLQGGTGFRPQSSASTAEIHVAPQDYAGHGPEDYGKKSPTGQPTPPSGAYNSDPTLDNAIRTALGQEQPRGALDHWAEPLPPRPPEQPTVRPAEPEVVRPPEQPEPRPTEQPADDRFAPVEPPTAPVEDRFAPVEQPTRTAAAERQDELIRGPEPALTKEEAVRRGIPYGSPEFPVEVTGVNLTREQQARANAAKQLRTEESKQAHNAQVEADFRAKAAATEDRFTPVEKPATPVEDPFEIPPWMRRTRPAPTEEAIQRDVIGRGRSGRPIRTEPLPIGTEEQILQRGYERATGPKGEPQEPSMQAMARQGAGEEPAKPAAKAPSLRIIPGVDAEGKSAQLVMRGQDVVSTHPDYYSAKQAMDRLQPAGGTAAKATPTTAKAAAAATTIPIDARTPLVAAPERSDTAFGKLAEGIKERFAPQMAGKAGSAGREIAQEANRQRRSAFGRAGRTYDQSQNILAPHRDTMAGMNDAARDKLLTAGETEGGGKSLPAEQQRLLAAHKIFTGMWESHAKGIEGNPLAEMNFIKNFVTHMYAAKDEAKAREFFGSSSKFGSRGSLRKRAYDTFAEANEKAGLKPLTNNILELDDRYGMAMRNTLGTIDLINQGKRSGHLAYFNPPKVVGATGSPEPHVMGGPPTGWVKVNVPQERGMQAYAPKQYADVLNNFFDKGLGGNTIAEAARNINSAWTQVELGINGYHMATMANEGVISKVAQGITQAFSGDIPQGVKTAVSAPWDVLSGKNYREGKVVQSKWLDPKNTDPIMKMLEDANARPVGTSHAQDYTTSDPRGPYVTSTKNIIPQLQAAAKEVGGEWSRAGSLNEKAMVPIRTAGRIIQTLSAPIFNHYIPAVKAGQMYKHMADWLEKTGYDPQKLTPAQYREGVNYARKNVDSIDNIFGEMTTENLNLNPIIKDAAQIGMRSPSWATGAIKGIGGGAYAVGKAAYRFGKTGENLMNITHPEHDPRAAYAIAFPIVIAMTSAMVQAALTGKGPEGWRDLYAPKTGGTVAGFGGRGAVPEHILTPGYQKDVLGWLHDPLQEAYNKMNGLLTTVIEQVRGKDSIGRPIYNPSASTLDQAAQRFNHLLGRVGPISVRNIIKGQEPDSRINLPLRAFGFRAPSSFIQDPAGYEKGMKAIDDRQWKAKQKSEERRERLLQ